MQAVHHCSFQQVNYSVYLEGPGKEPFELTRDSGYPRGNSSDHLYTVHSGLTSGASYTVVVEARSIAGLTVTRQEVVIDEQIFHGMHLFVTVYTVF